MPKKYLLYIHNPAFDLENKKSKLINSLLDYHYGPDGDLSLSPVSKPPKKAEDFIKLEPLEEELPEAVLLSGKTIAEGIPKLVAQPCKHGSYPEFCKHAKFVNGKKVCK